MSLACWMKVGATSIAMHPRPEPYKLSGVRSPPRPIWSPSLHPMDETVSLPISRYGRAISRAVRSTFSANSSPNPIASTTASACAGM